jgi:hypothetical protein
MQPFTIRVMGGHFTIRDILSQRSRSTEEMVGFMLTIPPERWFVTLDQDSDSGSSDALALIDDQFEFQTLATGTFQGDQ